MHLGEVYIGQGIRHNLRLHSACWLGCSNRKPRLQPRRPAVALLGIASLSRGGKKGPGTGLEDRVLSTLLSTSSVPYSSYIAEPRGFLHDVHSLIKQAWLVVVLSVAATASARSQALLSLATVVLTVANLPRRLWAAQLRRLAALSLLIFVFTALGADGVPPASQVRAPPPTVGALPAIPAASTGYRFVYFHWGIFTITRRSLSLASSAAALTFLALQNASLSLATTPSEDIALSLQTILWPLGWLGVPVRQFIMTLMLSLRFLAIVFEDARNLCLGLAVRGVNWTKMGSGSGILVILRLLGRLFDNLLHRSTDIAVAIHARGFVSADSHTIYTGSARRSSLLNNAICCAVIVLLLAKSML